MERNQLINLVTITDNQLSWISRFILQDHMDELADFECTSTKGEKFNGKLVGAEKWIRVNIDRSTASDVVDVATRCKDKDGAWKQLVHLGLPIKPL